MTTLLLAECLDAQNDEIKALFFVERRTGTMPPFSKKWCIQNKHTPLSERNPAKEPKT